MEGKLYISLKSGGEFEPIEFALKPGETSFINVPVAASAVPTGSVEGNVRLAWTAPTAVSVDKPFRLLVIDPSQLGNLLNNGAMEQADGNAPASWSGNAEVFNLSTLDKGPGFEGSAARFSGAKSEGYQHMNQNVTLPAPGSKYLYTTWVWNNDMQAGSNLSVDGQTFYIPSVFDAGFNTPFWRLMTHVRELLREPRRWG